MTLTLSERKSYPIYILLDVSASMRRAGPGGRSPHDGFQQLIPDLIMTLADSRSLAKAAWISVIAFGDHAELLCPMTSLTRPPHVRSPHSGRHTDYAAALGFLADRVGPDRETIEAAGAGQDYRTRVARPLIFFITDGAPYAHGRYQAPEEWRPARDRLVAAPVEARIAAIGLEGAHGGTLRALATGRPGGERNAFLADPGDQAAGDSLAASVITMIERSIRLSVRAGELIIDEPHGMRRVHG
ncbi:VWA domain-containing protein [Actinoplanes sp. NPDC026670]|uniref:vWA domain-containing protein n=1 Tax=Actinoplanes sp. NPDC026670 TaxID=3154700 RepID=UPI00340FB334